MKNLYWFTDEDGENILDDFRGTEKQAVKYAEKQARVLNENIYINCDEDIVDVAFAWPDQDSAETKFKEDAKTNSTLWETFESAYFEATRIPWRIYGSHSHRLLCHDYGELKKSELDDMEVIKCTKKNGYWRIVVAD